MTCWIDTLYPLPSTLYLAIPVARKKPKDAVYLRAVCRDCKTTFPTSRFHFNKRFLRCPSCGGIVGPAVRYIKRFTRTKRNT